MLHHKSGLHRGPKKRWILPRFEDPSPINRLLDPHIPEKFATQGGG